MLFPDWTLRLIQKGSKANGYGVLSHKFKSNKSSVLEACLDKTTVIPHIISAETILF